MNLDECTLHITYTLAFFVLYNIDIVSTVS